MFILYFTVFIQLSSIFPFLRLWRFSCSRVCFNRVCWRAHFLVALVIVYSSKTFRLQIHLYAIVDLIHFACSFGRHFYLDLYIHHGDFSRVTNAFPVSTYRIWYYNIIFILLAPDNGSILATSSVNITRVGRCPPWQNSTRWNTKRSKSDKRCAKNLFGRERIRWIKSSSANSGADSKSFSTGREVEEIWSTSHI